MRWVEAAGLRVSAIGLGGWQFGSPAWGWGRDWGPTEVRAICARAVELGVTLFDTAEIYGDGESERLLGDALSRSPARDSIVLATKVSPLGLTRERLRAAARASLDRLGTDRIDLYQVHGMDWRVAESVKMSGMRDLMASGDIRHVGVSNYDLARWREAEAALGRPVVSNQVRYSLLTRRPERELLPYAVANRRLLIAWSPLEQGLLSGKYTDGTTPQVDRPSTEYFSPENFRRAQPVIRALQELATARDATPAQVALAWLISHPGVAAIVGARSLAQLEENAAAADLTLAADEVAYLTATADRFRPTRTPGEEVREIARRAARRGRQLAGVERLWDRRQAGAPGA
jgi:aryl-alcohol dehydrogenase-like predicted oxidoreductase